MPVDTLHAAAKGEQGFLIMQESEAILRKIQLQQQAEAEAETNKQNEAILQVCIQVLRT